MDSVAIEGNHLRGRRLAQDGSACIHDDVEDLLLFLLPTKTMITPFEVSWMLPEVPTLLLRNRKSVVRLLPLHCRD